MRYLSLFSGIEAASVAWIPLDWECIGVAEIEPFPCKVLAHHYPHVPNLGSVTDITKEQVESLGKIDLVVGGFPCQDLSVAGKRKGLRHEDGSATRSGLFFTAMRIVEWAKPRWVLVENVPGLFSSQKGRDFAAVVGEMVGCEFDVPRDGWANAGCAVGNHGLVEWITLDAQFCRTPQYPRAVPQRRRRVFIVRDSGNWQGREPLFLDSESLRGNPPPSRKAGEAVAPTVSQGAPFSRTGNDRVEADAMVPITTCSGKDTFGTLMANCGQKQWLGNQEALTGLGIGANGDAAFTLQAAHSHAVAFKIRSGCEGGGKGYLGSEDSAVTLSTTHDQDVFTPQMQVRRLTPTECARLQGFPDDYLSQVSGASDSAMYKALGNSFACNVMQLIGQRIAMVQAQAQQRLFA